jgi:hypothetical protein
MARLVVALFVLTLSTIGFADKCKLCGYEKKHTHYPPYSSQLQEVIQIASTKLKVHLDKKDVDIINKIIKREDNSGNLKAYNRECYGLGQGKKYTYTNNGIPWKTVCPVEQVKMIILYIKNRYTTFLNAWKHHLKHNWY